MRKLPIIMAVCLLVAMATAATRSDKAAIARGLDIFSSVYKTLQTGYVDTIDAEKSINTAIMAMLDEIDPYTEYIPEKDQTDFKTISTGEYGGIGLVMKEHLWEPDRNWGYVRLNSPKEVTDEYEKYADMLYKLIGRGFAAAVYTQTTDVEVEVNGLMTYDRKVMKVLPERLKAANKAVIESMPLDME